MFELAAKICQCAKCANKALKSGQMRFQSLFSVFEHHLREARLKFMNDDEDKILWRI